MGLQTAVVRISTELLQSANQELLQTLPHLKAVTEHAKNMTQYVIGSIMLRDSDDLMPDDDKPVKNKPK